MEEDEDETFRGTDYPIDPDQGWEGTTDACPIDLVANLAISPIDSLACRDRIGEGEAPLLGCLSGDEALDMLVGDMDRRVEGAAMSAEVEPPPEEGECRDRPDPPGCRLPALSWLEGLTVDSTVEILYIGLEVEVLLAWDGLLTPTDLGWVVALFTERHPWLYGRLLIIWCPRPLLSPGRVPLLALVVSLSHHRLPY